MVLLVLLIKTKLCYTRFPNSIFTISSYIRRNTMQDYHSTLNNYEVMRVTKNTTKDSQKMTRKKHNKIQPTGKLLNIFKKVLNK